MFVCLSVNCSFLFNLQITENPIEMRYRRIENRKEKRRNPYSCGFTLFHFFFVFLLYFALLLFVDTQALSIFFEHYTDRWGLIYVYFYLYEYVGVYCNMQVCVWFSCEGIEKIARIRSFFFFCNTLPIESLQSHTVTFESWVKIQPQKKNSSIQFTITKIELRGKIIQSTRST